MEKSASIAVVEWSLEASSVDGGPVAVVRGYEGSELRLEVTEDEARWLVRGRHPAYAAHLRPMLDALAQPALWLELNASPSGTPVPRIVASSAGELHRKEIPVGLALLLCQPARLPLFMDATLLSEAPADRLDEEIVAFARFLESASADDFARYDERQR